MKKSFLLIGLIGLISLVGCKKEQQVTDMRFTATIENAAKTYFNISDETPNPGVVTWKAGDEVWVNGNTFTANNLSADGQTADLEGEGIPEGLYYAFYPISLSPVVNSDGATITLPATQTYYAGNEVHAPMYAYTEGSEMQFRNLCGMLVLNLQATGKILQSITVTSASTEMLTGTFAVTGAVASPVLDYATGGSNTVTLDCGTEGVSINNATNFYLYLPPANYSALQFTFTTTDGAACTKAFQAGGNDHSTFNVVRSQYNLLTFAGLTFIPAGAINGLFTINADGDQVWFSQGNLQYQASTNTWRFAEHQWDCVGTQTLEYGDIGGTVSGSDNANIASDYSGWIDLFGWGTSGWNSGANAYMPYSTSTSYSDYYPGGNENNDLTGDYAEADWAWHNAISNGGNVTHLWRTLTQAEWAYIFYTRANASSKWGFCRVNNIKGMIFLPDSWTMPSGITFTSGNSYNVYTLVQWAEMEAAGAVFLPAAGGRSGTGVTNVGVWGWYWSSTHYGSDNAYNMNFYGASPNVALYRNNGFSVRPVQVYTAD